MLESDSVTARYMNLSAAESSSPTWAAFRRWPASRTASKAPAARMSAVIDVEMLSASTASTVAVAMLAHRLRSAYVACPARSIFSISPSIKSDDR